MKCSNCLTDMERKHLTVCQDCLKDIEDDKDYFEKQLAKVKDQGRRRNAQIKDLKEKLTKALTLLTLHHITGYRWDNKKRVWTK